jgi:hypothetical protein
VKSSVCDTHAVTQRSSAVVVFWGGGWTRREGRRRREKQRVRTAEGATGDDVAKIIGTCAIGRARAFREGG